jgi:hypothetical protein
MVQNGPDTTMLKSSTRIPSSGPIDASEVAYIVQPHPPDNFSLGVILSAAKNDTKNLMTQKKEPESKMPSSPFCD